MTSDPHHSCITKYQVNNSCRYFIFNSKLQIDKIHVCGLELTSTSDLRGLGESSRRGCGETSLGLGERSLWLRASGLSLLGGVLRGEGLLRDLELGRAGETLDMHILQITH